jgi:hypothetical protein
MPPQPAGVDPFEAFNRSPGADPFEQFNPPPPTRMVEAEPEPFPEIAPLPPAKRGAYRGKRRHDNPWVSYGLIVAVPLALVLLIVAFSALPPYTPNSRAQSRPNPTGTGGSTASQGPQAAAPPATAVSVYEAEDGTHNTLGPTTKLRTLANASGGKVVTSIGRGTPAGDVKFNAITANTAGKYTLTVYYLNAGTAAMRLALWVNGRGPTIVSFPPSGAADRIGTVTATVTLVAGTNTIRFSNATKNPTPDLDRITITAQ